MDPGELIQQGVKFMGLFHQKEFLVLKNFFKVKNFSKKKNVWS